MPRPGRIFLAFWLAWSGTAARASAVEVRVAAGARGGRAGSAPVPRPAWRRAAPRAAGAPSLGGPGAALPRLARTVVPAALAAAAGVAPADLAPAGPELELTPGRVGQLRQVMLESELETPSFEPPEFDALFRAPEGSAPSARLGLKTVGELESLLFRMTHSLAKIYSIVEDPGDRARLAVAANGRYAAFLDAVASDAGVPFAVRDKARRQAARFFKEPVVVEELAFAGQTYQAAARLNETIRRLHGEEPAAPAAEPPAPSWEVPDPVPPARRLSDPRLTQDHILDPRDMARQIREMDFMVEKLTRRAVIARDGGFSRRLQTATLDALSEYADRARWMVEGWMGDIYRLAWQTLGLGVQSPRQRRIFGIPRHKGLRLVPEKGGFRLEATFYASIDHPGVLKTIKESIESYWQGSFRTSGRKHRMRTVVNIVRLAPGQAAPEGWLELRDGGNTMSVTEGHAISIGRRHFTYAMAAHEFGHILGLGEEYSETFDADRRLSVQAQRPGSIMGSNTGSVLSEHLRLAYLLVRRHHLATAP